MGNKPLLILMAEDDEGHARLVQRNLKRVGVVNEIVHLTDGQSALDFVRRCGRFAARPAAGPLLLLLDINMPGLSGIEVLSQIKADKSTARIPVIILTTTDEPREVEHCYQAGCSLYVTKPFDYATFVEAIKRLGLFLQVVNVPHEDERSK